MFDRAYVQSHNVFVDPLDVGALGEVALFYGDVELVLGSGSLRQLLTLYGAEQVVEFVSQGYVNPHYSNVSTAIHSEDLGGPRERHTPVTVRRDMTAEAEIVQIFRESTNRSGYGARKARAFIDAVQVVSLDEDWGDQIRENFSNERLVREAISATARHALGPNEGVDLTVSGYSWSGDALRFRVGGDWPRLQAAYERRRGEPLTTAHLLSPLVASLTDLQVASRFGADISTGHLGNELLTIKCAELERATANRLSGLAEFQNHVLHSRDIRGALNGGSRNLADLMQLLDRADRFKEWIRGKPLEVDLVHEYIRDVTADSWAANVPLKVIRFAATTLAGAVIAGPIGAGVGLVVGGVDELLIDRLLEGWRPNQFVEDELDPFVRG